MADYNSIADMMDTTENMEQLINNSGQDDNVLTIKGVDWFTFNGICATTLYVSGNSFIGMGKNTEHLQVCRRDTKLWNLYRQEATLHGTYRVLKIRWEGYAKYNSTGSDVALKYEWFFIENGNMFLNIIPPSNSSYLGNNQIVADTTKAFSVTAGQQAAICFYASDEDGTDFEVAYEVMEVEPPFDRRYLISDRDGVYYRVEHDEDEGTEQLIPIEVDELTADTFRLNGFTDMPGSEILGTLKNPVLLYWQDSDRELPVYEMKLTAIPPVQTVYSKNTEMTDSTIIGIEKVEIESDETTLFAFSFDGGETWKAYIDMTWVNLSEQTSGMNRETVESIGTDAWNEACTDKQYRIRFTLLEGGYVNRIIVHYLN